MTEYSKAAILGLWEELENADLGSLVSPVAAEIHRFFEAMFEGDDGEYEWYHTNELDGASRMAAYLRGFEWYYGSEEVHVAFCLDLHSAALTRDAVSEFHHWLLTQQAYNGDMFTWLDRYLRLQYEKEAAKPKRRSRKKIS